MTRDEIAAAMREANLNGQGPRLRERLRGMEPTAVFEALFQIAADAQRSGPAYRAACLLFVLKPACPISCKDAIQALLPSWDVSIEEVPWYLASQFEQGTISRAIEHLGREPLGHEERVRLGTVKYWTDTFFALTPEQRRKAERHSQRLDE